MSATGGLLHAEHPEAWSVTDSERARWVGARVRVSEQHPLGPCAATVVGVWRGLGFGGKWHVLADDGQQFGAFTGDLTLTVEVRAARG